MPCDGSCVVAGCTQSSNSDAAPPVTDYHTKVLTTFYAKYAPDKDSAAIEKALQRASKAGGLTWFDELCAALSKKYGDEPRALYTQSLIDSASTNKATTGAFPYNP